MMFRKLLFLIGCTLLVALAYESSVAAEPIEAMAQQAANRGTWRDHACGDCVLTVAATSDAFWVGTYSAGVIRHDRATGGIQQFNLDSGLGGRAVPRLDVGPDGDVWAKVQRENLGGAKAQLGVSHLQGQRWQFHGVANGLPSESVRDLFAGANASALVATPNGIGYFDGLRWINLGSLPLVPSSELTSVAFAGDGTIWAGSNLGLGWYEAGAWHRASMNGTSAAQVHDIEVADDGRVWAALGDTVGRYDPITDLWLEFPEVLAREIEATPYRIDIDELGGVWRISGLDVWHYTGQSFKKIDVVSSYSAQHGSHWPSGAHVDEQGGLVLSFVSEGIAHQQGEVWQRHLSQIGPPNLIPFAIAVDKDDRPWLGQFPFLDWDKVLASYDGSRWRRHGKAEGMLEASTLGILYTAIDADALGNVWVGVDSVGLARFDGMQWTSVLSPTLGASRIYTVEADGDGGVWVGTEGGAMHYDGSSVTRYTQAEGLADNLVSGIAVDPRVGKDVVWFGTGLGASRLEKGRWTTFTEADGLPNNQVSRIDLTSTGEVWLGTEDGLAHFDGSTWKRYGKRDGLRGDRFYSVVVDPSDHVWALPLNDEEGGGVSRFDGRRWETFTMEDGLLNNQAWDIAFDSKGKAWIATFMGVSEFEPPAPADPARPECVCATTQTRVPRAVIALALDVPASISGWGLRRNPSAPVSPMNPLRECLAIQSSSAAYHPLFNGLVWRAGCP